MKKVKACVLALAVVAMAMTSCSKEESANHDNLVPAMEQNEIMDGAKTYFVGINQFWENGDRIVIFDQSNNGAIYQVAAVENQEPTFEFVQNKNNQRPFNMQDGNLYATYPVSVNVDRTHVRIAGTQTTTAGELVNFPLYGAGAQNDFLFRNLLGCVRFRLTGDVALDSVAVTTEKRVNGQFTVNIENLTSPLSVNKSASFGTNTNMTKMRTPLQLNSTVKEVNVQLPAGVYEVFNVTFYANGKSYTMRNSNPITITRTRFTVVNRALSLANFEDFVYGTTNAQFALADGATCYIAKGNLNFIGGNYRYWRIADNGFDCIGTQQISGNSTADRDLFAWGANGYVNIAGAILGNGVRIWPVASTDGFRYSTNATMLAGTDEWGNNAIRNADQNVTWKTPTAAEITAILAGAFTTTLNFAGGVEGLVIRPATCGLGERETMTKAEWNAYEAAGCVFLPQTYHRTVRAGARNTSLIEENSGYWTSTAVNADNAVATMAEPVNKAHGLFVRLIAVAE